MIIQPLTAIASFLFVATLTLQGAHAQDKTARLVTRDELRVCMNSETELAARRQAMEARNNQNREEGAAIGAEAQQMAEEQARIEENSARMEKFARRVKAHNARVQAAQAHSASVRSDLEALNQSLVTHNDKCGGITFRAQDKEAILKEREPAKN